MSEAVFIIMNGVGVGLGLISWFEGSFIAIMEHKNGWRNDEEEMDLDGAKITHVMYAIIKRASYK